MESNKFFAKTTINGRSYQITKLPALKAMGMARTIAKVILPIIGGTIDGMRDDGLLHTPKTFTDLALVLCTQLDDLDLDGIIITLLQEATCDGKQIQSVDSHFQGDLGELLAVLEFALKENFSSFFTGNNLIAPLQKALKVVGVDLSPEQSEQ